jgi:hypothetical protein
MKSKITIPMIDFIKKSQIYALLKQALIPEMIHKKNYALGILSGTSPLNLSSPGNVNNPVLTAADVTDVPAVYIADPFLIQRGANWYMFFEVLNRESRKGELAVAESDDGLHWKYSQIILSEPFHLSYPYVFEWENEYYMIPESAEADGIRLYQAEVFPHRWSPVKTILPGCYADPSIFYHNQKWWLFAAQGHDRLYLFFADDFLGPWQEHPQSPLIIGDPHWARPGGRVVLFDGQLIRFAQDDFPTYGLKVHAFGITELSTAAYEEKLIADSLLKPRGLGWNAGGMHHICPWEIREHQWLAAVDGWSHRIKAFPTIKSTK